MERTLTAEYQTLYPRKDTLAEAVAAASAALPITSTNQLITVLMTFQNTLLHQQARERDQSDGGGHHF